MSAGIGVQRSTGLKGGEEKAHTVNVSKYYLSTVAIGSPYNTIA